VKDHIVVGGLMTLFAVLIVLLVAAICYDDAKWRAYESKHECTLTGQQREQWYLMSVFNGSTTTLIPQVLTEHEWKCNTGIVWR